MQLLIFSLTIIISRYLQISTLIFPEVQNKSREPSTDFHCICQKIRAKVYSADIHPECDTPPPSLRTPNAAAVISLYHRDQQHLLLLRFLLQVVGFPDCGNGGAVLFCQIP